MLLSILVVLQPSSRSVGFQQTTIADAQLGDVDIGVWYPTSGAPAAAPIGMFTQNVAVGGPISGGRLPLVILSHGTGGSLASHYDTAIELARAGFVVVGLTHPGDNSRDQSAAGNYRDLIDRPRHATRVIDYMVREWSGRSHVDSTRIGMFGASLGAYTALVLTGGVPDFARIREHCVHSPSAPECGFVTQRHGDQLGPPPNGIPASFRDARIRAVVVAAPALGFVFSKQGLAGLSIPVQLWRAAKDKDAPNATNSDVVVKALPRPPDVHTVAGAGHFVFLPPCSAALLAVAPSICQDGPGVDRAAFHATFNAAIAQFFREQLGTGAAHYGGDSRGALTLTQGREP